MFYAAFSTDGHELVFAQYDSEYIWGLGKNIKNSQNITKNFKKRLFFSFYCCIIICTVVFVQEEGAKKSHMSEIMLIRIQKHGSNVKK